jgi:hypothetical protein
MSSRGARRVGALVSAVLVLMSAPADADAPPTLEATSFPNAWVAPTIIVDDEPGGRPYEITDPPYKWSDGRVEYLVTRWSEAVCDGSMPGDTPPQVLVVEHDDPDLPDDGKPVTGVVAVEDLDARPVALRSRVVRWTVNDPAYPHGLAAGRHVDETNTETADDVRGGGAPFMVEWRVYLRLYNGLCDTSQESVFTTTVGIDRFLPQTVITEPRRAEYPDEVTTTCVEQLPPRSRCPLASALPAYPPQRGALVVRGIATDPATPPAQFGPLLATLETSGVAAVVVRLYSSRRRLMRFWVFENPDCAHPHAFDPTILRCSPTMPFEVDMSQILRAGTQYGVDAYAIDRAGLRTLTLQARSGLSDHNTIGPASSVQFLYLGNV